MNKFISSVKKMAIKFLGAPLYLINKIKVNNKSLLMPVLNVYLSNQQKTELGKSVLLKNLYQDSGVRRFQLAVILNLFAKENDLSKKFQKNLINNFSEFYSQLCQDCFVDTWFDNKTNGTFIEIGVGDGVNISNTFFLEKNRGWTGLLCEPAVKFHESIKNQRKASLIPFAVYKSTGELINFVEVEGEEELSTIEDFKDKDFHNRNSIKKYSVATIAFNDLVKEFMPGKKVDYLSIDTEGSELTILASIDFANIEVSVISVEFNYDLDKYRKIGEILTAHGYYEPLPGVFEFECFFVK